MKTESSVSPDLINTSDACMIAKYNPLKANLCDDLRIYGLLPDSPEYQEDFNPYTPVLKQGSREGFFRPFAAK